MLTAESTFVGEISGFGGSGSLGIRGFGDDQLFAFWTTFGSVFDMFVGSFLVVDSGVFKGFD